MSTLRYTTAGESHGPAEICVLEGVPAGLALSRSDIDIHLQRRRQGYGRGGRMAIETDRCRFLSGIRQGRTLGTPICVMVENKDHANWLDLMSPEPSQAEGGVPLAESLAPRAEGAAQDRVGIPRPGHADLAGLMKYGHTDVRDVLERASARETTGRVIAGSICRRLLSEFGVRLQGRVTSIGPVRCAGSPDFTRPESVDWTAVEESQVACDDPVAAAAMCEAIDRAREAGDTLGGVFEIWAWGLCPGLGGYAASTDRLDGRLMGALGSIPAIKAAEIGEGYRHAARPGSLVHDPIVLFDEGGRRSVARETNRSAGIEGGMTTGMPVIVRAAMKPIATLTSPLPSVDVRTLEPADAHVERSDVTAVPAARVVGEAMVALVLAEVYMDKFGGDSLEQTLSAIRAYESTLEERGLWRRS